MSHYMDFDPYLIRERRSSPEASVISSKKLHPSLSAPRA
jgi:hypothetical protein